MLFEVGPELLNGERELIEDFPVNSENVLCGIDGRYSAVISIICANLRYVASVGMISQDMNKGVNAISKTSGSSILQLVQEKSQPETLNPNP